MKSDSKSRLKQGSKDKRYIKVGFLFCAIVVLLDLTVWYLGRHEYLAFLDIFTSRVITSLIHMTGLPARMDSNTIYLTNSVWLMTTECTAIFLMLIYASFILVYPSSIKSKCIALVTGIPFIFAANLARLLIMAWIDKLKPQYSEFFHNYAWQVVFIVMVIFMWMIWISKVVNREADSSVSA